MYVLGFIRVDMSIGGATCACAKEMQTSTTTDMVEQRPTHVQRIDYAHNALDNADNVACHASAAINVE